jgi:hypothetical protein
MYQSYARQLPDTYSCVAQPGHLNGCCKSIKIEAKSGVFLNTSHGGKARRSPCFWLLFMRRRRRSIVRSATLPRLCDAPARFISVKSMNIR